MNEAVAPDLLLFGKINKQSIVQYLSEKAWSLNIRIWDFSYQFVVLNLIFLTACTPLDDVIGLIKLCGGLLFIQTWRDDSNGN